MHAKGSKGIFTVGKFSVLVNSQNRKIYVDFYPKGDIEKPTCYFSGSPEEIMDLLSCVLDKLPGLRASVLSARLSGEKEESKNGSKRA